MLTLPQQQDSKLNVIKRNQILKKAWSNILGISQNSDITYTRLHPEMNTECWKMIIMIIIFRTTLLSIGTMVIISLLFANYVR